MTGNWIENDWKQLKSAVRERWARLTDDDLNVIAGRRSQLVARVQERYGIARDEAHRQVADWSGSSAGQPAVVYSNRKAS